MEQAKTINLKKCKVRSKTGDTYLMNMRLESGRHSKYTYRAGDTFVSWGERTYKLSDDALAMVSIRTAEFDKRVQEMLAGGEGCFTAEYSNPDLILHICRLSTGEIRCYYDALFEYEAHSDRTLVIAENIKIETMMRYIRERYMDTDDEKTLIALRPTPETLYTHPLYTAAEKAGDSWLTACLEMLYGKYRNDGKECLPDVSEEFDREYCVITDTIPKATIYRSGYDVLHRPYFAMRNCDHCLATVNPYRKVVVDAGKIDAPRLTFAEFIRIIDG